MKRLFAVSLNASFVIALAVSSHGAQFRPGDGSAGEGLLITNVDVEELARIVYGDVVPAATTVRMNSLGIEHTFEIAGGNHVGIVVGIYSGSEGAGTAFGRSEPSMARILPNRLGDQHLISAKWLHVRYANLLLMLDILNVDSGESASTVASALEKAMTKGEVVAIGSRVNTPEFSIVEARRLSTDAVNVILDVPQDQGRVFVQWANATPNGRYRINCRRSLLEAEPTVRVARSC